MMGVLLLGVVLLHGGVITHGGEKPNIIPAYTELEFYLRTPLGKDLRDLKAKAEACFTAAAVATGCQDDAEQMSEPIAKGHCSITATGNHCQMHLTTQRNTPEAAGAETAQLYTLRTAKAPPTTAVDVVCCPDRLRKVREDFGLAKLKQEK